MAGMDRGQALFQKLKRGTASLAQRTGSGAARLGWRRSALLGVICLVLLAASALGLRIALLPGLEELEARAEDRLLFTDATGAPLLMEGIKPSDYASLERIPEHLRQAVIAVEDARFPDHGGLDYRAIGRAFWANLRAGEVVQGGSTLTQQLVKIRYLERDRTYARKLHEALLAREMEASWSKDEILERYLNSIYLGNGAHGVVAAARLHFGREVEDLTLAESAAIAAMIQAPSAVNPKADPEALRERAGYVLRRMEVEGMIEAGAANAARAALTTLSPRQTELAYGGWFTDWVAARAEGISDQFEGDSTLRTTLDPALQQRAERAVAEVLGDSTTEAAVVVLRSDGTVAAMVGGRDYRASQYNRATQALRQPGSTFKLFTYLAALEAGLTPNDVISDVPIEIDGYAPENIDGRHHGEVTLREAFARSYNAAAVRLADRIGVERVAEAARALGIEAELSETPSLALGASGVTLLDLTEAYAALASGRPGLEARGLSGISTGAEGTFYPFDWSDPAPSDYATRLMEQRGPMTEMLRAAVTQGTGSAAAEVPGAVGKTGTSQNFRDALFVGWAGELVAGVWVGMDDNAPMDGVTGGKAPAMIWARLMGGSAAAAPAPEAVAEAPEETPEAAPALTEAEQAPLPEREPAAARAALPRDLDPARLRTLLEAARDGDVQQVVEALRAQGASPRCNVRRCERAYRSFRASDCTFQPYGGGPRKLCTR
jgi:1A family penicillin-binding protein